jgi:hypothetical protein
MGLDEIAITEFVPAWTELPSVQKDIEMIENLSAMF